MTIQRENREQQAEILNFIARLFEMHDPETGRMVQVIHSPERLDALKAGAAALSRQREQAVEEPREGERYQPVPVPSGDGRHDIGDDVRAAIVERLTSDWTRDPDLTPEKARQLAMWSAASVRALLHELGTLRDMGKSEENSSQPVQPSAALSQPSRQLESDDGAGLAAGDNDTGPSTTETASWREARAAGAGWLNQYGATSMEGVIIKNLLAAPLTEARELTYKKMRLFEPNMSAFNALGQLLNEIDALISKQEIAWKTRT